LVDVDVELFDVKLDEPATPIRDGAQHSFDRALASAIAIAMLTVVDLDTAFDGIAAEHLPGSTFKPERRDRAKPEPRLIYGIDPSLFRAGASDVQSDGSRPGFFDRLSFASAHLPIGIGNCQQTGVVRPQVSLADTANLAAVAFGFRSSELSLQLLLVLSCAAQFAR
jgi:hypothetical protein